MEKWKLREQANQSFVNVHSTSYMTSKIC